jgi:hypothetical protein
MFRRSMLYAVPVLMVAVGVASCGDDDDTAATTTRAATTTVAPTTAAPTTTRPEEPTTTRGGGGATTTTDPGMQAGAPSFTSFEISSSVPCEDGNATVTMKYTTINVVSIAIKIGDGRFEETAGYGPNETDVVAEIPCSGAASSSITLQGCTEDNECAESDTLPVTITG